MSRNETEHAFFEACETGKGWEPCLVWCHEDATFFVKQTPWPTPRHWRHIRNG